MVRNQAASAYQKATVETADPVTLVVMCYERTIRDLESARQLHGQKRMDQAYDKIRHAQDIITELLIGLDYERGGDIAANLSRLYNFMLRELMAVNAQKSPRIYDHVVKMLAELKEAWVQIRQEHGHEAISLKDNHAVGPPGYRVTG